jgi:hypothetical protein
MELRHLRYFVAVGAYGRQFDRAIARFTPLSIERLPRALARTFDWRHERVVRADLQIHRRLAADRATSP